MPDDAGAQIGDVDAFRELGHTGQTLNFARVEPGQVGLAVFVFGVIGGLG